MREGYYELKLPSGYRLYDGVKLEEVFIRPMNGGDEKLMAECTGYNFEEKSLMLLKRVIDGMNPEELTLGDRLFCFLWLKINSYSQFYDIEYQCDSCLEEGIEKVDLSTINIKELDKDYKEPYVLQLPTGKEIKLRLFRAKDELKIHKYELKNKKNAWMFRWALSIVDHSDDLIEVMNYYETLLAKDTAIIRAFQEYFYHGPEFKSSYKCKVCGHEGDINYSFSIKMLFPYGSSLRDYFRTSISSNISSKDELKGGKSAGVKRTSVVFESTKDRT